MLHFPKLSLLLMVIMILIIITTTLLTRETTKSETYIVQGVYSATDDEWDPEHDSVGVYASQVSGEAGDSIAFHISTDVPTYTLKIWREGATRQLMKSVHNIPGSEHGCEDGYSPPGCNWPAAYTLTIPSNWTSGPYTVEIPTFGKGTQKTIFWVREDHLGSTSKVIFLSAVNTYQAYTFFGGKSVYDFNSTDGPANKVSFNRPYRNSGLGDFKLERPLIVWAENNSYTMEYAAESDLEVDGDLLDNYEVVIIAGHSEYWSWNMRQRLKAFINDGGRLINLSGNTMWWQVRFEDDGRTLVSYKEDADTQDPLFDSAEEATGNPWDYPIFDMETSITGAHWKFGGYFDSVNDNTFRHADGYGGYFVQKADHWIFANTGLENGDMFGRTGTKSLLGKDAENDGTTFNCETDGATIRGPIGNTGTPHNYTILGYAPTSLDYSITDHLGFAVMGIYTNENGGAVFSANTTGWPLALSHNAKVSQVTKNVFDTFIAKSFPQEPVSSSDTDYLFYDRFNCNNMNHTGVLPSYSGPAWYEGVPRHNYFRVFGKSENLNYTEACGVDGSGLQITIDPNDYEDWLSYQSQVKPNWASTDVLYTRKYLNFSDLDLAHAEGFSLMEFQHDDRNGTVTSLGSVGVFRWLDEISISYEDEATKESVSVIINPNETFELEVIWDKSNNKSGLILNREQIVTQTINMSDYEEINRVDLTLNGWTFENTTGHICVDEFAFDDERIEITSSLNTVYLPILTR